MKHGSPREVASRVWRAERLWDRQHGVKKIKGTRREAEEWLLYLAVRDSDMTVLDRMVAYRCFFSNEKKHEDLAAIREAFGVEGGNMQELGGSTERGVRRRGHWHIGRRHDYEDPADCGGQGEGEQ